uniref:RWP-RK domain-containing protein n=1 Tax=Prasinoderma coloniale TaxID=156133 RepID=A0A7R9TV41_9VIRI|mmetsp:Transcript_6419/g.25996  ORF Transcript_6419/g.25996 Transcript_6419/m.25996 type:complete len:1086 (+) Transcript_6419:289-3546(+)|eukprot:PRCOL_00003269-RA
MSDDYNAALQRVCTRAAESSDDILVQVWRVVQSKGGSHMARTLGQPFALGAGGASRSPNGALARYRTHSCDFDMRLARGAARAHMPGRVLLSGRPEFSPNVSLYRDEEFLRLGKAYSLGVRATMALPLFIGASEEPTPGAAPHGFNGAYGVLEVTSLAEDIHFKEEMCGRVKALLRKEGIETSPPPPPSAAAGSVDVAVPPGAWGSADLAGVPRVPVPAGLAPAMIKLLSGDSGLDCARSGGGAVGDVEVMLVQCWALDDGGPARFLSGQGGDELQQRGPQPDALRTAPSPPCLSAARFPFAVSGKGSAAWGYRRVCCSQSYDTSTASYRQSEASTRTPSVVRAFDEGSLVVTADLASADLFECPLRDVARISGATSLASCAIDAVQMPLPEDSAPGAREPEADRQGGTKDGGSQRDGAPAEQTVAGSTGEERAREMAQTHTVAAGDAEQSRTCRVVVEIVFRGMASRSSDAVATAAARVIAQLAELTRTGAKECGVDVRLVLPDDIGRLERERRAREDSEAKERAEEALAGELPARAAAAAAATAATAAGGATTAPAHAPSSAVEEDSGTFYGSSKHRNKLQKLKRIELVQQDDERAAQPTDVARAAATGVADDPNPSARDTAGDKQSAKKRKQSDRGVSIQTLQSHFHMKLVDASKALGVCTTTLKRICRAHGIMRWPCRKLKKMDVMDSDLRKLHEDVSGGALGSIGATPSGADGGGVAGEHARTPSSLPHGERLAASAGLYGHTEAVPDAGNGDAAVAPPRQGGGPPQLSPYQYGTQTLQGVMPRDVPPRGMMAGLGASLPLGQSGHTPPLLSLQGFTPLGPGMSPFPLTPLPGSLPATPGQTNAPYALATHALTPGMLAQLVGVSTPANGEDCGGSAGHQAAHLMQKAELPHAGPHHILARLAGVPPLAVGALPIGPAPPAPHHVVPRGAGKDGSPEEASNFPEGGNTNDPTASGYVHQENLPQTNALQQQQITQPGSDVTACGDSGDIVIKAKYGGETVRVRMPAAQAALATVIARVATAIGCAPPAALKMRYLDREGDLIRLETQQDFDELVAATLEARPAEVPQRPLTVRLDVVDAL